MKYCLFFEQILHEGFIEFCYDFPAENDELAVKEAEQYCKKRPTKPRSLYQYLYLNRVVCVKIWGGYQRAPK